MARLLGLLIFGAIAIALAPSLLSSGSAWGIGLAILLMFFLLPKLAGSLMGGGIGFLAVVALALFALNNPRACSLASIPTGDVGNVTELSRIAYFAESEYDTCLGGYINASQIQPLRTAVDRCDASAAEYVNRCLPTVQEEWWILDKEGACRDRASEAAWRPCAQTAVGEYYPDALGACQGRSTYTGLMRRIAGLFSGQSTATGGSTPSGTSTPNASYDTTCLVRTYNYYLGYIKKDLGCQQFTATQYEDGKQPRVVVTDEAKYQECIVESLIVNVGDTGRQAAQQCQVQR
jgi:hypothetical protein